MQQRGTKKTDRFHTLPLSIFIAMLLAVAPIFLAPQPVFAGTALQNRYDRLGSSRIGAVTTHTIGFDYTDFGTPIGSLLLQFCDNSPLIYVACSPPSGMDMSSATLGAQTGETGFVVAPGATANTMILTRPAAVPTTGPSSYELADVINPNVNGTFYLRIQTFTAVDASGANVQEGAMALSTAEGVSVSLEVPPYLTLCVAVVITALDCSTATSFFIDIGELSSTQARAASSQILSATNAPFGYSIFMTGTTLTSGNNTINALSTQAASNPGTSQFGINLRANSNPTSGAEPAGPGTASFTGNYGVPNLFRFVSGDTIVTTPESNDLKKFTVTYMVNVSKTQPAGVYASTFNYICLANF